MLEQIPLVSRDVAAVIVQRFPTLQHLLTAYDAASTGAQAELLLQDILVTSPHLFFDAFFSPPFVERTTTDAVTGTLFPHASC